MTSSILGLSNCHWCRHSAHFEKHTTERARAGVARTRRARRRSIRGALQMPRRSVCGLRANRVAFCALLGMLLRATDGATLDIHGTSEDGNAAAICFHDSEHDGADHDGKAVCLSHRSSDEGLNVSHSLHVHDVVTANGTSLQALQMQVAELTAELQSVKALLSTLLSPPSAHPRQARHRLVHRRRCHQRHRPRHPLTRLRPRRGTR